MPHELFRQSNVTCCVLSTITQKCATIVLTISYEFVEGVLAITFLLLVISSRIYIQIAHFCNVMSIDMTLQKWAIFIMGAMREIFVFCRIKLKCCSWLYKKTLTHIMKFSARNNKQEKNVHVSPKSL